MPEGEPNTGGGNTPTPRRIDAGGAYVPGSTLDPTNPKDQAMMRREMMRHPGRFRAIVDARKDRWAKGLDIAQEVGEVAVTSASHEERIDGANLIVSSVRTGLMMAALDQKDEHKALDIETGANKTEVNVNVGVGVKFIKGVDGESV